MLSGRINKVWYVKGLTRTEFIDQISVADKLDSISDDDNALSSVASKRHKMLDNLLCIIHRDGGHHIKENGYEKSVSDAIDIIHEGRE